MESTKYGKRRVGRWTPLRAKAQDTRANPISWETHLVRKRWDIGLLRSLSLWIMMLMMKLEDGETDDPETIANHLNEFFAGVGESLSKQISPSGKAPEDYLDPPQQNSFALYPTIPQEIIDLARLARYNQSSGPDDIDPLVANSTLEPVAELISAIINSSFSTG